MTVLITTEPGEGIMRCKLGLSGLSLSISEMMLPRQGTPVTRQITRGKHLIAWRSACN